MRELPYINFFTPDILDGFWQYTKSYLWIGAPLIMIIFAFMVAEHFFGIITSLFQKKRNRDDEKDETEVFYY